MALNRFFLPFSTSGLQSITFPSDTSHQIARVLRLKPGEHVIILDGSGDEMDVVLDEVTSQSTSGHMVSRRTSPGEPRARLVLMVALTQREKFEWILQKCTEVGVSTFIPVITTRSLAQDPKDASRKLERWQKIVQEAAEQSGRGRIPAIQEPCKLPNALTLPAQDNLRLLAWEEEHAHSLPAVITAARGTQPPRVTILIGPEGGITNEEADMAKAAGFQAVTLGSRILRMETAAIAAAILALHALGDM